MRKFFDDFLMMCRKLDVDKWVHVVGGIVIAWLVTALLFLLLAVTSFSLPPRAVLGLFGVVGGVVLCLLKEWYDKRTTGLFDGQDLAAGFVGIAIFYIIYSL